MLFLEYEILENFRIDALGYKHFLCLSSFEIYPRPERVSNTLILHYKNDDKSAKKERKDF